LARGRQLTEHAVCRLGTHGASSVSHGFRGEIWLRPSAVIGVARETTRTTAMRLVDGKVYNVAGSPKEVLDVLGATFTSRAT